MCGMPYLSRRISTGALTPPQSRRSAGGSRRRRSASSAASNSAAVIPAAAQTASTDCSPRITVRSCPSSSMLDVLPSIQTEEPRQVAAEDEVEVGGRNEAGVEPDVVEDLGIGAVAEYVGHVRAPGEGGRAAFVVETAHAVECPRVGVLHFA